MIASQYFAGGMFVGNIPGISFAYEQRLNNVGIYNANQLFVQYHLLQQNYAAFTGWLVNTCGATTPYANLCFNAIQAQYGQYVDLNYDFTDEVVCSLELIRTEIML